MSVGMDTKMGYMPHKPRPKEEIVGVLSDYEQGLSVKDICQKYEISQTTFFRMLRVSRGFPADATRRKIENKVQKLEKTLKEREREIVLLKAALKKS